MKKALRDQGHIPEHFFKGVCICPCKDCIHAPAGPVFKCTCPDCPPGLCGAKTPTRTL